MIAVNPNEIDVLILGGGLGKRLRKVVDDRPKPMAKISNRPFLDILINYVALFGFRRFILSIGYRGSFIRKYYAQRKDTRGIKIIFSEEKKPLGTGGAVKKAKPLIRNSPFLVMNGDSFCNLDLNKFLNFHLKKNSLLSIALTDQIKTDDCGRVRIFPSGRISIFKEKCARFKSHLVNTGIYLFNQDVFPLMPPKKQFSLEKDFFPKVHGKSYGYITHEDLIDIGTPDRYKKAERSLSKYLKLKKKWKN